VILDDKFTHVASVYRNTATTGWKSAYQQVETGLACLIQPVIAEFYSTTNMAYGRTYNGYFKSGADIQISDYIIDQTGKRYNVTGSMNRDYGNLVSHLEVLLTEQPKATPDQ
jgi:hypothetical protein